MPKVVDHDLRRREVARAAVRVIAREGLDAATTRAVANESGWTTGVLRHYFADKDEVLRSALRELEESCVRHFDQATEQPDGFAAICAALLALVLSDPDQTRVWVAFISRAISDERTARDMRSGMAVWRHRWGHLVHRGQLDGSVRADVDADHTAEELYSLVNGLRIQSLFAAPRDEMAARIGEGRLGLLQSIRSNPRRPMCCS